MSESIVLAKIKYTIEIWCSEQYFVKKSALLNVLANDNANKECQKI